MILLNCFRHLFLIHNSKERSVQNRKRKNKNSYGSNFHWFFMHIIAEIKRTTLTKRNGIVLCLTVNLWKMFWTTWPHVRQVTIVTYRIAVSRGKLLIIGISVRYSSALFVYKARIHEMNIKKPKRLVNYEDHFANFLSGCKFVSIL